MGTGILARPTRSKVVVRVTTLPTNDSDPTTDTMYLILRCIPHEGIFRNEQVSDVDQNS